MAIYHVIKLLNAIETDHELRHEMYSCIDQSELIDYLYSKSYFFDNDDIVNAINFLHVQCQTIEDAQQLLHKADWLKLLISGK